MTLETAALAIEIAHAAADAPAERIMLIPAGTLRPRDGRGPWRVDPTRLVAETRAYYRQTDMVVDYDHQTARSPKVAGQAPAAGWVKKLEARRDGVWGQVEWTAEAARRIAAREYRYISPSFQVDDSGRVALLASASLVNVPALDMLAIASTTFNKEFPDMDLKDRLAELLGLEGEPGDDDIAAAVKRVMENPDPRRFVPRDQVESMLRDHSASVTATLSADVERMVDQAVTAGKLPPALRDWGLQLCAADAESFQTFTETMPPVVATGAMLPKGAPPAVRTETASAEDDLICAQLGISVEDLRKTEKGR